MRGHHSLPVTAAIGCLTASIAVVGAIILGVTEARPHDAKSGWSYPFACCSTMDCRDVPADWIEERPEGFRIVPTGEIVPMSDARVKHSPDGRFHWCSVAGAIDSRTICLFVPPRSF